MFTEPTSKGMGQLMAKTSGAIRLMTWAGSRSGLTGAGWATPNYRVEAMALSDVDRLLDGKTLAVVGLSPSPRRHSHEVTQYMQAHGYRIVPVNPNVDEVLGERAYARLTDIPVDIDVVNVFRRPEHLASIVDEAISKGVVGIWTQLGVVDNDAAVKARAAGLIVVMNQCIMVEHSRRRA